MSQNIIPNLLKKVVPLQYMWSVTRGGFSFEAGGDAEVWRLGMMESATQHSNSVA
jgi:hypothetical protein